MDRNNNSSTGIPGDTETPCPCSRHGVISGLCRVGIKYGGYRTAGSRDKSLQHRKQRFISGDHAYHRRYFTKPGLHIHFYDTCSHVRSCNRKELLEGIPLVIQCGSIIILLDYTRLYPYNGRRHQQVWTWRSRRVCSVLRSGRSASTDASVEKQGVGGGSPPVE